MHEPQVNRQKGNMPRAITENPSGRHIRPSMGHPDNPLLNAYARLQEAERLRKARAYDQAEVICAGLVKAHPDYFGALQTLGRVQADRGDYNAARVNLTRAIMLNPCDWRGLAVLGQVYLKLGASEIAMRTLEQAQALNPDDLGIIATLAQAYSQEGEYELAVPAYERAVAIEPSRSFRLGLGWSLDGLGRTREAAQIFETLVREDPKDVAALSALSQMPARLIGIDMLKNFDALSNSSGLAREDFEIIRAFARANALHRAGLHEAAWRDMTAANDRVFAAVRLSCSQDEQQRAQVLERLRAVESKKLVPPTERGECRSLFILGPARSGKTTLEGLAALLPEVRRGYENPLVENAIRRTFQIAGFIVPKQLDLPPALEELFRQHYFSELEMRAKGASVFTNTQPGGIVSAWRLAAIMPGVRVVFVKRDPRDLAISIYLRHFRSGHPYAYDLPATFRFIGWYHEMMERTAALFPDLVRIVSYEDIIADPRKVLASVAELCGLAMPENPDLPELGDDRGAAAPYRAAMDRMLGAA